MEEDNKLKAGDFTKIIKQHHEEYCKATKSGKKAILDNLESVIPMRSRKSIARTLRNKPKSFSTELYEKSASVTGARGRPIVYTPEVDKALEEIWLAYDCPCAERLHPEIANAIAIFKRDDDWYYTDNVNALLISMSVSTMRNKLVGMARKHRLERGISTTRASHLKELVPVFHDDWNKMPIGYGQIDTVVHSGGELLTPMVYTVNFVDMQTYWQEMVAQLNKTDEATLASIATIEQRLPFPLTGLHPDSGNEFLNWLLFDWCRNRLIHYSGYYGGKIDLTRSRPNKKNDNCSIEERNGNIIRKYVGYERYDCREAVDVLNELYGVLRLYVNYFQPVQKLKSKVRQANGKYKRIYGPARTPYQRVIDYPGITEETKTKLQAEYETLNPKRLLSRIKALTIKLRKVQIAQGYHG